MSKLTANVRIALLPIIEECGVELIDIEYKKVMSDMHLTVFIDKEGGVTLNDCETVHRLIDTVLDELNPTNDMPYILNVSSPGLDRPIKTARDFEKNKGKEVSVSLFNKIEDGKKFVAILKEYDLDNDVVTFEINNKTIEIELKNIALIKPEIKF